MFFYIAIFFIYFPVTNKIREWSANKNQGAKNGM